MMNCKLKINYLLIFILLGFSNSQITLHAQKEIPANFCISVEESKLYNLVNEYRRAMKLPDIPLSKSLCFVAKTHLNDLIQHKPDTGSCNMHSWSDKGEWKACCFQKVKADKPCVQKKPTEITKYPGSAFEIVYWESKEASPEMAFKQWRETKPSQSMLINNEDWTDFSWNAVGVGISGSYAAIWFGEELDIEKETKVCGKNIVFTNNPPVINDEPQLITLPTNRFYVIFGSFSSINDAKAQAVKHVEEGFKKTKIISKDNKFRISLTDYTTKELAEQGKGELPSKYKDAWIMEY